MGTHGHSRLGARRTPLTWWVLVAPIAVLTLAGMVWLWPSDGAVPAPTAPDIEQVDGVVIALDLMPCEGRATGEDDRCGLATVEVEEGPDAGRQAVASLPSTAGAPRLVEGDQVVMIRDTGGEGPPYAIVDYERTSELWILLGAFALALIAFGRWRGLSALAGLAVTFALLILFVVPAILAGEPPLLVAIVGSAATMLVVLYLTHGFALSTTSPSSAPWPASRSPASCRRSRSRPCASPASPTTCRPLWASVRGSTPRACSSPAS